MQIQGQIREIYNEKQVSDKFKLREFVISTADQYPQHIKLQCTQDRCNLLDTVMVGDTVTAHINIRGKQYTKKDGTVDYFNSIECWKLEKQSGAGTTPTPTPTPSATDDLPF